MDSVQNSQARILSDKDHPITYLPDLLRRWDQNHSKALTFSFLMLFVSFSDEFWIKSYGQIFEKCENCRQNPCFLIIHVFLFTVLESMFFNGRGQYLIIFGPILQIFPKSRLRVLKRKKCCKEKFYYPIFTRIVYGG